MDKKVCDNFKRQDNDEEFEYMKSNLKNIIYLDDSGLELLFYFLDYEYLDEYLMSVVSVLNELMDRYGAYSNINSEALNPTEQVLKDSIETEGLYSLSRILFNFSNLNFCHQAINERKFLTNLTEISPFTKLGLYTLFDTKLNNEVDSGILNNFTFKTLNIIKNKGHIQINNEFILKSIRNGLAHDQFYIYPGDGKLNIRFFNKGYFEATMSLDELFELFDSVLDFPLNKIKFDDVEEMHVLGVELLLSLIFNNNKDHFLSEFVEKQFGKLDARGFDSVWHDKEHESCKEFKRYIFEFKTEEDRQTLYDEYGRDTVLSSLDERNLPKIFGLKYHLFKMNKIHFLYFRLKRVLINCDNMSFDRENDIHIPTNVLMNKIRNSVAHGFYKYDRISKLFTFTDKYKGRRIFTTKISIKDLETILTNPLFIKTILIPKPILLGIKFNSEESEFRRINQILNKFMYSDSNNLDIIRTYNKLINMLKGKINSFKGEDTGGSNDDEISIAKLKEEIDAVIDYYEFEENRILNSSDYTEEEKKELIKALYTAFDRYVNQNPEFSGRHL